MTTIAWRGNTLAADSICTDGSRQTRYEKLLRARGAAYGCSGDLSEIWAFFEALRAGEALKDIKLKGDFSCLMLTPGGCFQMERDLRPHPVCGDYWAIGSGAEYALGAMFYGKSARQAIAAACAHDAHSGGEVQICTVRQRRR